MKVIKKIIISSIIVGVLIYGSFYAYVNYRVKTSKDYYEVVKNNPKVYVYDTVNCILNPAMYITDIAGKDDFIKYYTSLYKSNEDIKNGLVKRKLIIVAGDTMGYSDLVSIPFPIKYLPYPRLVFFNGYVDKDSLIAEVVDFDTRCWGYIKGYVYHTNVHKNPPSEERLEKVSENSNVRKDVSSDKLYKKPSAYGCQCW